MGCARSRNKGFVESLADTDAFLQGAAETKAKKEPVWKKITQALPELKVRTLIPWQRLVAAAAIIVAIVGAYFLFRPINSKSSNDKPIVILPVKGDVIVTLASGEKIVYDSIQTDFLTEKDSTRIIKRDNTLVYETSNRVTGVPLMNAIETKKGKKFELVLSDGSRVTLNAMSKLEFPIAFVGKTRTVSLTEGEAFFQIVKDKQKPFFVQTPKMNIQVVGTSFNVKAYKNTAEIKGTLFEGKIKVQEDTVEFDLEPGQELVYDAAIGKYRFVKTADLEQVSSWRQGILNFKSATIGEVMQTLERRYDIDVQYNGKIAQAFTAEIPDYLELSVVLQILEATGGVHFTIRGKSITVIP